MIKNNINQSENLSQEPQREKRKYTKHDYFADLDKKVRIWKSILEQFDRVQESYKKRDAINLSGTQEDVSEYIATLAAKEGKLLYSSEKIQKLYAELQELANQETGTFIFDYSNTFKMKNLRRDSLLCLIDNYNELTLEKKEQNQRIQDIQALINFEKKQIQVEIEKKKKEKKNSNPNHSLLQTSSQRILNLYKRVRKDEAEIKQIQLGLQRKAKELFQVSQDWFSEKIVNDCIKEFKEVYSGLETALVAEAQLKKQLMGALENMKKNVEQEKIRLAQQKATSSNKVAEKSPEEKIQEGFKMALETNQNLVLVGQYRSLGLVNSVIQKINEDEEYKQDIIEHILGLLKTPQGQDFGKSGNSRWKPVQGSDVLYELSVNPKKQGHSQSMPRFYAKKEIFVQDGNVLELTHNKDKRPTDSIWVLVRKGSKRTQDNDIDMAEKVYFENDGLPHRGQVYVNALGWEKVDIRPGQTLKSLSIVKGKERE